MGNVELTYDILIYGMGGYLAIGLVILMWSVKSGNKFYDMCIAELSDMSVSVGSFWTLVGCFGAWPIVIMWEILGPRRKR